MTKDTLISLDLVLNLISFLFIHFFRRDITPQIEQLRRDVNLLLGRYDEKL